MNKLAIIPLLGVLLTMAPLAAFADTPNITVMGNNTYYTNDIWNGSYLDGDDLLISGTCTGFENGHYVGVLYDDNYQYVVNMQCDSSSFNNFLMQFEGLDTTTDWHVVIYDQTQVGTNEDFSQSDYISTASTTEPWFVSDTPIHIHTGTRPS